MSRHPTVVPEMIIIPLLIWFKTIFFCQAPHTKIRVRGEETEWVTDEYIGMTYKRVDLKQKAEKRKDLELWTKYKEYDKQSK